MWPNVTQRLVTQLIRSCNGPPAFRIYAKADYERDWREVDVFATHRRNCDSSWRLCRGYGITLSMDVVAIGWDCAADVLEDLGSLSVTRERPLRVAGGRLKDKARRLAAGGDEYYSNAELLAHECGHTGQARRLGFLFWPLVGALTLFREGPHWWNGLENQASRTGLFGGIIPGTLHPRLQQPGTC